MTRKKISRILLVIILLTSIYVTINFFYFLEPQKTILINIYDEEVNNKTLNSEPKVVVSEFYIPNRKATKLIEAFKKSYDNEDIIMKTYSYVRGGGRMPISFVTENHIINTRLQEFYIIILRSRSDPNNTDLTIEKYKIKK
ncbi:hypothetical protein KMW28_24385 [Flammeovirga yaeyamensis]|uniref:Uncharacterized protein n=1 Tax=Flammeovirga yaeyamensis TaxID=367791 RepID=A0AAX1N915_9BACT|nr:hypothetical protein [Flammeovirga yaeyamensis]MBB3699576.1 hypothetical protein [Flammeovirga yaeyamensis]NMF35169.1 hypothetical protein [Flammeovirga yaeyamensis]QWG04033.1 hypothetical protein KMW28_24385 [Flammeovirga yaeyamensis]